MGSWKCNERWILVHLPLLASKCWIEVKSSSRCFLGYKHQVLVYVHVMQCSEEDSKIPEKLKRFTLTLSMDRMSFYSSPSVFAVSLHIIWFHISFIREQGVLYHPLMFTASSLIVIPEGVINQIWIKLYHSLTKTHKFSNAFAWRKVSCYLFSSFSTSLAKNTLLNKTIAWL